MREDKTMTVNIAIYVFQNVEVLDFAGPYEVFTCATRVQQRDDATKPAAFNVFTVGSSKMPVTARAGLLVSPDCDFTSHPVIDVLIVAGGVVDQELNKTDVIDWIRHAAGKCQLTVSVCTGAFLLARAGLLDDRPATTHWEDQQDLQQMFPEVDVRGNCRWVDDGDIITSGGISAGIDMSLHIVERMLGRSLAARTARQMEFDWTENAPILKT